MDQERIEAYFAAHREEMLEDICRLVRIRSVREEAKPGMPFGQGPCRAMEAAQALLEERGFAVRDFDRYALDVDLNDQPPKLGILAHLDVVEEGRGWTMDPYAPVLRDGRLYGRGTADDKGPAVAALYAMMAAREIEPKLRHGVRLILGSAEETGSEDLEYYFAREQAPEMCFSPDAEFPIINIEKGRYAPRFSASWAESAALPRVRRVTGGATANIIPQNAEAVTEGLEEAALRPACDAMTARTGVAFALTKQPDGSILVAAEGHGAHASAPQEGKNAQTALLALLAELPFAQSEQQAMLCKLAALFPFDDYGGHTLGVYEEDAISGKLTLGFTVLELGLTGFTGGFDARLPICTQGEALRKAVEQRLGAQGIRVENTGVTPPHHTPEEGPLVQTLLKVYAQYTGQPGSCIAIGGGTYVHEIQGGVAFGCTMPGTDNRMHGPDEFAVVEELLLSAKMFTQVILDLCR